MTTDKLNKLAENFNNLNLSYFGISDTHQIIDATASTNIERIAQIEATLDILQQNISADGSDKTSYYALPRHYFNGSSLTTTVSPFSLTANNVQNKVLILLQDWSSHDTLKDLFTQNKQDIIENIEELGYTPSLKTNLILSNYLNQYIISENSPLYTPKPKQVTINAKEYTQNTLKNFYISNIFPFIKFGDISAPIPSKDAKKLGLPVALKLIEELKPRLIICLGNHAFHSLTEHYKKDGDISSFRVTIPGANYQTKIWRQRHPSRPSKESQDNWDKMGQWCKENVEFAAS